MKSKFKQYYSDASFWKKLQQFARLAGIQSVYAALLLFFLMKSNAVPPRTKLSIAAALGYFIFPVDAIPDLVPAIGFTDDFGVLLFALSQIKQHLSPEIMEQARLQLSSWFDTVGPGELDDFHKKLL